MKEIFRIKFDKHKTDEGINVYRMYTLEATGLVDDELLTPQKITIKDGKVIVNFKELGIKHVFAYTDDCELFYRDKIKTEDADKTTDKTE